MPRNVSYLERFEYFCRECDKKGTVLDVLLNPDVLLIRGFCAVCKKRGTYKVIDIEALRQEHEAIAREESANGPSVERVGATRRSARRQKLEGSTTDASAAKAQKRAAVSWKWELLPGRTEVLEDDSET
jgi:hypothetical protein